MKTTAAVMWTQPGEWTVQEVELDAPRDGEVLVRIEASGLCHSDDHIARNDVTIPHLPFCGGHEGAGVVEAIGPGVRSLQVGDHIVTSFVPGCGRCRWCASGMQNLCDNGAFMLMGTQLDGTFRMHADGHDIGQSSLIGTFSRHSVMSELSCVKIPHDIPFTSACLLGCGVPTGWGSAVNAAGVQPGEVVIVTGIGGIGINAVQGARIAGAGHILAVDPVPFKREMAQKLGATEVFESIDEAADHARSLTNGQGADSAIVTIGVTTGDHIGEAFRAIRKAGTVVVTGVANMAESSAPINLFELSMYQKRLQGCLFGMAAPSRDVIRLIDLYRRGLLELDGLVTRTYAIEDINQGYADMHAGRNIRGVITYER